jgi:hypothetical protein
MRRAVYTHPISLLFLVYGKAKNKEERWTHAKSIAAHIIRADGQIAHLQSLDAVDVETLVDDATLGRDIAALAGGHAAGAQGVPGCFDVALN